MKNKIEKLDPNKIFEELFYLKQNPTPSVSQKLRIQHLQQLLDVERIDEEVEEKYNLPEIKKFLKK